MGQAIALLLMRRKKLKRNAAVIRKSHKPRTTATIFCTVTTELYRI